MIGMAAGIKAQNGDEVHEKLGHHYVTKFDQLQARLAADLKLDKVADALDSVKEPSGVALDVGGVVVDVLGAVGGAVAPAGADVALATLGPIGSGAGLTFQVVSSI